MIWIVLAAVAVVVAVVVVRRILAKRRESRLVSFVGLLREPVSFDPAVLARLAGRAWNADLGDGSNEGPDGFVVGGGGFMTIVHEGRMFLINSFPTTYVENVDEAASAIRDLRIRSLFGEHRAWFSCDALGVDGTTPDEVVRDWYRRLSKLFVELLDENCLLIFLPDSSLAYPINEETEAALRADDPRAALDETLAAPLLEVSADDPAMIKAVEDARAAWPKFAAALENRTGRNFAVKAPVTAGGNTEFIWITVTCVEGETVYGELGNDPANLGSLKLGSKVSVPVGSVADWIYLDAKDEMVGGYSIAAVQNASRKPGKK